MPRRVRAAAGRISCRRTPLLLPTLNLTAPFQHPRFKPLAPLQLGAPSSATGVPRATPVVLAAAVRPQNAIPYASPGYQVRQARVFDRRTGPCGARRQPISTCFPAPDRFEAVRAQKTRSASSCRCQAQLRSAPPHHRSHESQALFDCLQRRDFCRTTSTTARALQQLPSYTTPSPLRADVRLTPPNPNNIQPGWSSRSGRFPLQIQERSRNRQARSRRAAAAPLPTLDFVVSYGTLAAASTDRHRQQFQPGVFGLQVAVPLRRRPINSRGARRRPTIRIEAGFENARRSTRSSRTGSSSF